MAITNSVSPMALLFARNKWNDYILAFVGLVQRPFFTADISCVE